MRGHFYSRGYEIINRRNVIIYSAGNHPLDSQRFISPSEGLSIKTLEKFCEQTGKELAKENGEKWLGCSFIED